MKWYYYLYDAIWGVCLFTIMRGEATEVVWTIRHKGWLAIWLEYINVWNLVDWFSIFGGIHQVNPMNELKNSILTRQLLDIVT